MKFFVDTADVDTIRELAAAGLVDGVTTNPSLIAKTGRPLKTVIAAICSEISGPVSAEVGATTFDDMLREGLALASLARNVTVKVPLTLDGLQACRALRARGIAVNVTLCFSANQALLAAKAGASFISPFIGRLEDKGEDGLGLIRDIRTIYDRFGFTTALLAASIRSAEHVRQCALIGADVATVPPATLRALAHHPLTDAGLEQFLADWKKSGQAV